MPVFKCPNGKYRIGSGQCMYTSKAKALRAYAAYRAISHSEAFMEYLRFVVKGVKMAIAEDTTTVNVAPLLRRNVWRRARILRRMFIDLELKRKNTI